MLPVSDNDRIEKDSFGEVRVGASALWGAQTRRAVVNFQIGHLPMPAALIRAPGLIKWAAAVTNGELGEFKPKLAATIARLLDPVRLAHGGTAQGDP
jgi:fumarate hydratase class II